ncbi:MAG: hypothetical protein NVS9B10_02380 [Nevskia sp.]
MTYSAATARLMMRLLTFGLLAVMLGGCERPDHVQMVQRGYRGTGMEQVYNVWKVEEQTAANIAPAPLPPVPAGGPPASTVFKNVPVLGNLGVGEFTRTMLAMTAWVAPKQGCAYCHNTANMADDSLYTKVVARRMLQMTQHVNSTWQKHVSTTGVTCYTCHRGNPVPTNVWYANPGPPTADNAGNKGGQNLPLETNGYTSLPFDPFSTFLEGAAPIRVVGTTALPEGNRQSIKQTEWTYSLMVHMSKSLGVNCTYCHNSRSFTDWDQSPPTRVMAWYGIRMVRDLNHAYLDPLAPVFPPARHGELGDAPKLNCATCHQGAYKPLYGVSMAKDYPQLLGPIAAPAVEYPASPTTEAAPAEAAPPAGNSGVAAPATPAAAARIKTSATAESGATPPT